MKLVLTEAYITWLLALVGAGLGDIGRSAAVFCSYTKIEILWSVNPSRDLM